MDQEVAKTLGELELKLQELERELTTIGHHDKPPQPADKSSQQSRAPGRLIDEAVEHLDASDGKPDAVSSAEDQAIAEGDGFGGPPVFGGEENPSRAGATVEREWTTEARETAYGEIPTPPSPPDAPGPPHTPSSPHQPPPAPDPPSPPGRPGPSPPTPGHTPPSPDPSPPIPPPTPQPPSPLPPSPPALEHDNSIELAELVRFRDKLAATMQELIDEYSRLLSRKPSA